MMYEAPKLTALAPAIDAIQAGKHNSGTDPKDTPCAYEDWE